MTGSVEEVLAQLRAAVGQLDTAAVTALRARADAEQAQTHFTEAAEGSDHPKIKAAVTDSRTGAEKAGKVGRLISEATRHIAKYANHINPGSIPTDRATESATPSGEELVSDAFRRASARSGVGALLSKMTSGADDLQDSARSNTEAAQHIIDAFRHRNDPSGAHPTSGTTEVVLQPQPADRVEAPEVASNVVLIGLVAGLMIQQTQVRFRKARERLNTRDREARTERPNPGDGSA